MTKMRGVVGSEPHLCTHDESYEEGDHRHAQDQQLSAVSSPEGLGVHVHHSCHQTLHTHKLWKERRPDLKKKKNSLETFCPVLFHSFHTFFFFCGNWLRNGTNHPHSCSVLTEGESETFEKGLRADFDWRLLQRDHFIRIFYRSGVNAGRCFLT